MKKIRTHEDLDLWQLSMDFVLEIYSVTAKFPGSERYGLTSQLKRAAISIPSNIAEGAARHSSKEMMRFLYIALGSIAEIETQIEIANRLEYCSSITTLKTQLFRLKTMTIKLIRSLNLKENSIL